MARERKNDEKITITYGDLKTAVTVGVKDAIQTLTADRPGVPPIPPTAVMTLTLMAVVLQADIGRAIDEYLDFTEIAAANEPVTAES